MKIYKLNYTDKETAIADLLAKSVYIQDNEELIYGKGIHAVVEIGKILNTEGTYDKNGKELTAPTYYDGYAYDVMSEQEIKFENEIFPETPKHGFAGY